MRKSHVCLGCGGDLRRERVATEPHYGLPMVTCPRCGATAVRRRDPIVVQMQSARRVGVSLSALVLQIATVITAVAFVTVACDEIRISDIESALAGDPRYVPEVVFGLIFVPIAVGTWLTAGLGHWPRWAAWAAFFLLPLLFLTINAVLEAFVGQRTMYPNDGWRALWSLFPQRVGVLAIIMIVATMGIPIGRACRQVHASARRRLWRTRRRWRRERSPR